jgi:toxin ParE1/3/4
VAARRLCGSGGRDLRGSAPLNEREKSGLGFRFETDLGRVFSRLAENPLQFPEIEMEARRALLRRFPYGVFFTVAADVVTVLAVLHLHRHPDTWKDRPRT